MRNALRTVLATAVVAGVALTPVVTATTALAAPSVSKAAAAKNDRYSGLPVYIGKGYVAVLRNHTADGGPEAWIRAVGPDWQRGDTYMTRVMTVLDRKQTSAVVDGIRLRLNRVGGELPELVVSGAGSTNTTVYFPERVDDAPDPTPAPAKPVRTVALKGGLTAKLYHRGEQHRYFTATVLKGGKVLGELKAGGGYTSKDSDVFAGVRVVLTSEGLITSAMAGPYGGQGESGDSGRLVRTQTLLGGLKGKVYAHDEGKHVYYSAHILEKDGNQLGVLRAGFDHAPKDQEVYPEVLVRVTLDSRGKLMSYDVDMGGSDKGTGGKGTGGKGTGGKGSTGTPGKGAPATSTPAPAPAAQTGATGVQVVPKGAVAAGAEIKGGGDDHTVLVAGGAGLASVGAAGLGFVALRRRAGARG
ncbi:hypothetical protein [Streptomyces crystallinus]|uniref:Gram-positive cocci surface proteins LPxTG domain-containing protein n=1 Tax=Streptomyces crystallinus TaxID=68191 RepID=A0ABN1FB28_9ACTN